MEDTKFPRLRERRRVTTSGKEVFYFFWDGRGRGLNEISLGSDRELALKRWAECERGIYPKGGKFRSSLIAIRRTGSRRTLGGDDWRGVDSAYRTMYFNAERRAIAAKRPFLLKPGEFLTLVELAGGKCQVSGLPFEPLGSPFAPSLDRIDSTKGYEMGNVRLVCHVANVAMNKWGLDPVLRLSDALLRKQ